MNETFLNKELSRFLEEDLGRTEVDDSTELPLIEANVIAEEPGILCGGQFFLKTLELLTPRRFYQGEKRLRTLPPDGTAFKAGEIVIAFDAHPEVLRHGVRTGLNLLQILCGIATNTQRLVNLTVGTWCQLQDTRKTTPGFRAFEKYAVRIGHGRNHRFNREDGILLKKEDLKLDGGIKAAVDKAKRSSSHLISIEVEVENWEEFLEAKGDARVTHILLDNMPPEMVRACVEKKGGKTLEASGVTVDNLRAYAETGVPFISTSALIRNARPLKMRMRIA